MRARSLRWGLALALPLMLGLSACGNDTTPPDETKYEDPDHGDTCTDGIDNDEDGLLDCEELSCMATDACNPEISIQDVQDASSANHPALGDSVTLTEAVVTAVSGTSFWMQQGTGPFSGVYVYKATGDAVSVGDVVSVTGEVDEYNDLTEIKNATATVLSTGADLPAPEALEPAAFADGAAMEQWESVLVTVAHDDGTPMVVDFWADAGAFSLDEEALSVYGKLFEYAAEAQEEIQSLTGVVDYYGGADLWQVLPRSAEDVVSLGVPTDLEGPLANCEDGLDNDGNGSADCEDAACYGAPACVGGMTVAEVRAAALNTFVRVVDMTVTAVDSRGFWVQAGIGPDVSLYVYTNDAPSVAIGDVVEVVGLRDERILSEGTPAEFHLLRIATPEVTVTGSAEPQANAVMLADFVANPAPWESALVTITDESGNLIVDASPAKEWTVQGGSLTVFGSLVDLPVVEGAEIVSLTGVVSYYTAFQLYPRLVSDAVFTTEAGCFDGFDNDQDGSTDCDDAACVEATECTTPVVNISDIQDGTVVDGTPVKVTGAVVTAVASKGAWIQQGTGPQSGVYVYTSGLPVAIGDVVSLFGEADEYNGLTQVRSATAVVTGTAELPAPEPLDVTTFETPAELEQWEGVLVMVTKSTGAMAVTQAPNDANYYEWVLDGAATVDDVMYRAEPALDAQVTSVTGPLDYSFGAYKVQPRSADDVVFTTP